MGSMVFPHLALSMGSIRFISDVFAPIDFSLRRSIVMFFTSDTVLVLILLEIGDPMAWVSANIGCFELLVDFLGFKSPIMVDFFPESVFAEFGFPSASWSLPTFSIETPLAFFANSELLTCCFVSLPDNLLLLGHFLTRGFGGFE
ncbi:hypothetical protein U1Q18_051049 [Sarracenia purpurea var. burkii]